MHRLLSFTSYLIGSPINRTVFFLYKPNIEHNLEFLLFYVFQINMEAVTSTDYNSANLSRNFNQVGFNTYNYSQFEQKIKPKQMFKYGEEYDHGHQRNSSRTFGRQESRISGGKHPPESLAKFEERYTRSQSQPERKHQMHNEARSKSQDSRAELTYYEIDSQEKQHESQYSSFYRQNDKGREVVKSELKFYEIDGPPLSLTQNAEKVKEVKLSQSEKYDKRGEKGDRERDRDNSITTFNQTRTNCNVLLLGVDGKCNNYGSTEAADNHNHTANYKKTQSSSQSAVIEPPKYRAYDRPPRYQETPPKPDPPPKYLQDPPKYSEVTKIQDMMIVDSKRAQVSMTRLCNNEIFSKLYDEGLENDNSRRNHLLFLFPSLHGCYAD